jgi:hypothetical protein
MFTNRIKIIQVNEYLCEIETEIKIPKEQAIGMALEYFERTSDEEKQEMLIETRETGEVQ